MCWGILALVDILSDGTSGDQLTAMMMTPRVRKLTLTAHVTSSVGWLRAVGAFLALAIAG